MAIKSTQELKQLQSRRTKLLASIKVAEEDSKEKNRLCSQLKEQLKAINQKITDLENSEVIVTEHAIIRYLERAMGLDLEQIKREILSERNEALIEQLGSGKYPIGSGLKAVVKGKAIVSIV